MAAQDVQHSADGTAYEQYAQSGAALAADLTAAPHAVTCWYDPASQAASEGVSAKLNLRAALSGLADAFGRPSADGAVTSVTRGPFGRLGCDLHRPGRRLDGGQLARRQCQLVRHHAGQLRWVPVDGRTGRNKLAGGSRSGSVSVLSPASRANSHTVW